MGRGSETVGFRVQGLIVSNSHQNQRSLVQYPGPGSPTTPARTWPEKLAEACAPERTVASLGLGV